jgi:hypothetical protein
MIEYSRDDHRISIGIARPMLAIGHENFSMNWKQTAGFARANVCSVDRIIDECLAIIRCVADGAGDRDTFAVRIEIDSPRRYAMCGMSNGHTGEGDSHHRSDHQRAHFAF